MSNAVGDLVIDDLKKALSIRKLKKQVTNRDNRLLGHNRMYTDRYNREQGIKYHPRVTWVINTIKSHKKKGYTVELEHNYLLKVAEETNYCNICGKLLMWSKRIAWDSDFKCYHSGIYKHTLKGRGLHPATPTLDRVNNEKHIDKDNFQIVCMECNITKSKRTMKEFMDYCNLISKRDKEGLIEHD